MGKIKTQFSVKLKSGVDQKVLKFANMQSNFNDTVLYLFEKEIAQNGVRNLQEYIPPVRNILGESSASQVEIKREGVTTDLKNNPEINIKSHDVISEMSMKENTLITKETEKVNLNEHTEDDDEIPEGYR